MSPVTATGDRPTRALGRPSDLVRSFRAGVEAQTIREGERPALTIRWLPVFVAVAVVVLLLRQRGAGALDTLYAEDGAVFLVDAMVRPVWRTLWEPYAGYMHSIPRLVAALVALLPLRFAPAAFAIVADIAIGSVAYLTARVFHGWLRSNAATVLVAASFIALPVGLEEVFNATANIHWFLILPTLCLLMWRPRGAAFAVVSGLTVLLAVTSDPLVLALAPVAALRIVVAEGWRDRVAAIAFVAGSVVQLSVMWSDAGTRMFEPVLDLPRMLAQFAFHVLTRGMVGERLAGQSDGWGAVVLTAFATASLVVIATWYLRRTRRDRAVPIVLCVMASLGFFLLPTVLVAGIFSPRYTVVPIQFLMAAVAIAIASAPRSAEGVGSRIHRRTGALVVVSILALWSTSLPLDNDRAAGPTWSAQLGVAVERCRTTGTDEISMEIVPWGWEMDVPCRELATPAPTGPGQGSSSRRTTEEHL